MIRTGAAHSHKLSPTAHVPTPLSPGNRRSKYQYQSQYKYQYRYRYQYRYHNNHIHKLLECNHHRWGDHRSKGATQRKSGSAPVLATREVSLSQSTSLKRHSSFRSPVPAPAIQFVLQTIHFIWINTSVWLLKSVYRTRVPHRFSTESMSTSNSGLFNNIT